MGGPELAARTLWAPDICQKSPAKSQRLEPFANANSPPPSTTLYPGLTWPTQFPTGTRVHGKDFRDLTDLLGLDMDALFQPPALRALPFAD